MTAKVVVNFDFANYELATEFFDKMQRLLEVQSMTILDNVGTEDEEVVGMYVRPA